MSDVIYPIDAILGHYGWELPHLGGTGWQKVRCHEHDDTHASATINLDLGAVKCFGCDFHGDAIAVIRLKEGCTYREAVRIAEGIAGGNGRPVRRTDQPGGRLPSEQRNQSRGGRYVPSWRRSKV